LLSYAHLEFLLTSLPHLSTNFYTEKMMAVAGQGERLKSAAQSAKRYAIWTLPLSEMH